MSQNKNPLQAIIDAEKAKSGINVLSTRQVSSKISAVLRNDNSDWKDNVKAAGKKRSDNPEWRKNIAIANKNKILSPASIKKASESQKKRFANFTEEQRQEHAQKSIDKWKDSEYVEKIRTQYYDNPEYLKILQKRAKETANRPEMKEWYLKFNQDKRSDPNHLEKHQAGVTDRSNNNEEWIRKNCRPVSTPYGIFQKAKDVMDLYHAEHGGNRESVAVKLRNWLKSDKKLDWKYLSWEEYDSLTNK